MKLTSGSEADRHNQEAIGEDDESSPSAASLGHGSVIERLLGAYNHVNVTASELQIDIGCILWIQRE